MKRILHHILFIVRGAVMIIFPSINTDAFNFPQQQFVLCLADQRRRGKKHGGTIKSPRTTFIRFLRLNPRFDAMLFHCVKLAVLRRCSTASGRNYFNNFNKVFLLLCCLITILSCGEGYRFRKSYYSFPTQQQQYRKQPLLPQQQQGKSIIFLLSFSYE